MAIGDLGRIMRFNGDSDVKHALGRIQRWGTSHQLVAGDASSIELLARVADVTTMHLVRHHTLVSYRRAFVRRVDQTALLHGAPATREVMRITGHRSLRAACYFCPTCACEDLSFHGSSYWRRSHQLPGAAVCVKHQCGLHYTYVDGAAFRSPMDLEGHSFAPDEQWSASVSAHPEIHKFLELASYLALSNAPYDEQTVSRLVRQRALARGWSVGPVGSSRGAIEEALLSRFDATWLEEVVEDLYADWNDRKKETSLERALYGGRERVSPGVYLLLLCVFYETAEMAMAALHAAHEQPTREDDALSSATSASRSSKSRRPVGRARASAEVGSVGV